MKRHAKLLAAAVLALLVLTVGVMRWAVLDDQPIQHDEVYSYLAAQGVLHQHASVFDPTGYPYNRAVIHHYVSAVILDWAGESLASMRGLSVIAGLLAIVFLYRITRQWAGRVAALSACALFGFSIWQTFHAVSARMYVPYQLCFLIVIWSALRIIGKPDRKRYWILLLVALFAAAGIHKIMLASAPALVIGLVWGLRGRCPVPRLALGLLGIAVALWAGLFVHQAAPVFTSSRQEYGTWSIPAGNPLRNIGLVFVRFLHDRAPLTPWLALFALPYSLALKHRRFAFGALLFVLTGLATAAGKEVQGARYYLHLLPLGIGLACATVDRLVRDVVARRNTLAECMTTFLAGWDTLRARFDWFPSARATAIVAGVAAGTFSLAGDALFGLETRLGHDQIVLLCLAIALLALAALWRFQSAILPFVNAALLVGLGLAILLNAGGFARSFGSYRYPPFQSEALAALSSRLAPGDRILATEHLVPFVKLGDQAPIGFLSQKIQPDGTLGSYAEPEDWVTGVAFVDSLDKLHSWVTAGGTTYILADYRMELHLEPSMRAVIESYPLVFETDVTRVADYSPNPEWAGDTSVFRIFAAESGASASDLDFPPSGE